MKRQVSVLYVDQAVAFGGSLVVLRHLVNALGRERLSQAVIVEIDTSILQNHIDREIPVYRVPRLYNYVHWSGTRRFTRKFGSRWIRFLLDYLLSAAGSLANTPYLVRVMYLIVRHRADIVHVNNGMNNLAPVVAGLLLGRRVVVHFHGMERHGFLQRRLIRHISGFIVISEYLKRELEARGMPGSKMKVIPNPVPKAGVYGDGAALREQYGIGGDDRVIGIVGRIVRWKGHIEFLEAARQVHQVRGHIRILIVGDYSDGDRFYQDQIMRLVDSAGLRDCTVFTGYTDNVGACYSIMDICVHASIEPEPFGLVITEAMAHGVPVIASDRGAPVEIINNGQNGFLVDPEDTESLAKTIIRLIDDGELRRLIGENGRTHVLRKYGLGNYAEEIMRFYREILGGQA